MNTSETDSRSLHSRCRFRRWSAIAATVLLLIGLAAWVMHAYQERLRILALHDDELVRLDREARRLDAYIQQTEQRIVEQFDIRIRLTPQVIRTLTDSNVAAMNRVLDRCLQELSQENKVRRKTALSNISLLIAELQPHLDDRAPEVVEQIAPLVQDADIEIAWHAIDSLQRIGWRSKSAWNQLLGIAVDLEDPLAPKAVYAMGEIDAIHGRIPRYDTLSVVGQSDWIVFQRQLPRKRRELPRDEELKRVLQKLEADEKRRRQLNAVDAQPDAK